MMRAALAYIAGSAIAPLTAAAITFIVLRLVGPLYIFQAETIWDLADQAAPSLGFFVIMGALPALLFLAPVAFLVHHRGLQLAHSACAGAIAGLAFFSYAAAYAALLENGINPPQTVHLSLFWFFGANFGDLLATAWFRSGAPAFLYALGPIAAGSFSGVIFHSLGRAGRAR